MTFGAHTVSALVLCIVPCTAWANTALETTTLNTSPYDAILREFVDADGMVDYKRLQQNRGPLDAFIALLGEVDPAIYAAWPEGDRMAFLFNAYNAITLQRIIDHYPIKRGGMVSALRFPENSIRQIDGVWNRLTTRVLGRNMTLDHIEHEILRRDFQEPRLHAALVCAAVGCPPLRAEAYTGTRLNEQLDDQSRRFLAAPHRFRINRERNTVLLSPILKWYGGDFTGIYNVPAIISGQPRDIAAVLEYASRHVAHEDAEFIRAGGYRVEFLDYDWSLNERP